MPFPRSGLWSPLAVFPREMWLGHTYTLSSENKLHWYSSLSEFGVLGRLDFLLQGFQLTLGLQNGLLLSCDFCLKVAHLLVECFRWCTLVCVCVGEREGRVRVIDTPTTLKCSHVY